MKRILLALTIVALLVPAARQAAAADVSVDLFYNNLSGGDWIEAGDYGYGWQPAVAVSDSNWRPYSDGYWAYTDVGWTWVSYEDFGWATYHYGRWSRVADHGWVWFPGNDLEWGPAWVSWRTGGDYIGWAPLPPRGAGIAYEGRAIGGRVDVEFDIGPSYYNFVDVRYIGEPVLRDRIFASSQNVTYINQTVNVTNITTTNNVVYNYGPDYNTLSARSSRPIQRLSLERQENADLSAAAKSGALTKVQGDKLIVAAPAKLQKPAKPIAPPSVKAKVTQDKIDKGWTGVPNANELKQKMKTEDLKKVPPPTGAAATGQPSPAFSASPTASAAAAASASPFERGKPKGKAAQRLQPNVTASPGVSPAQGLASPTPIPRGKPGKGKRGELQNAPTSPASVPTTTPPGEKEKGKFDRGNLGTTPSPGESSTPATNLNSSKSNRYKSTTPSPSETAAEGKKINTKANTSDFERAVPSQTPAQPGGVSNQPPPGKHKEPPAAASIPYSAGGPGGAPEAQGGKHKGPPAGVQPAASAAERSPAAERGPAVERGPGKPPPQKPEGGKKKGEASPSPTP